jgi:hypothetical protein
VVFTASALLPIPLGHRYVLLSVFFLQLALVRLLLNLTPYAGAPGTWASRLWLRIPAWLGVFALLAYMTVTNVAVAREHFEHTAGSSRAEESVTLRCARRVGELAGPHAIVLSTALASWSLPTFGPKIVPPYHKNPLIVDADERRRAALRFFAPGAPDAERDAIIAAYHVTHVLVPPRNAAAVSRYLSAARLLARLPGGSELYALSVRSVR